MTVFGWFPKWFVKLLRCGNLLCHFMISSSSSFSKSMYVYVFGLVLFPSSHLGQGELMNLVILIMTYLCLWVPECFVPFFFLVPQVEFKPIPECFLKLSCLSQFLGCMSKNLTKEKLKIYCDNLKKFIPNSPYLSVVELAFWKPKKLFSKLSQPELLMESFIHDFWLQMVAKAPTIVHDIPCPTFKLWHTQKTF